MSMCIKHIEPHRTSVVRALSLSALSVNFLYFYIFNHRPSVPSFVLIYRFRFLGFFPSVMLRIQERIQWQVCTQHGWLYLSTQKKKKRVWVRTERFKCAEKRRWRRQWQKRRAHIKAKWMKENFTDKYISWKSSVCTFHAEIYTIHISVKDVCVCTCTVSIVMLEIHFSRLVRCCHWWLMLFLMLPL